MKTVFYIFLFWLPVVVFGQDNGYNAFPTSREWKFVGSPGFFPGTSRELSFAMNPATLEPYVAIYNDLFAGLYILKFDGSSWVTVGTTGVTDAGSIAIVFNSPGIFSMAYLNDVRGIVALFLMI